MASALRDAGARVRLCPPVVSSGGIEGKLFYISEQLQLGAGVSELKATHEKGQKYVVV